MSEFQLPNGDVIIIREGVIQERTESGNIVIWSPDRTKYYGCITHAGILHVTDDSGFKRIRSTNPAVQLLDMLLYEREDELDPIVLAKIKRLLQCYYPQWKRWNRELLEATRKGMDTKTGK